MTLQSVTAKENNKNSAKNTNKNKTRIKSYTYKNPYIGLKNYYKINDYCINETGKKCKSIFENSKI